MKESAITRGNVGRIAERIVSNELEFEGFRVSDLNADGTSANADLLAVGHGKTWQIQVKGATNAPTDKFWWVQYGYCTQEMIADKRVRMFNKRDSFYKADFVVLVAIRSPREYTCIVLPTVEAEKAVQINMDGYYRQPRKNGSTEPKKAGKVYVNLEPNPNSRIINEYTDKERKLLSPYRDNWGILK